MSSSTMLTLTFGVVRALLGVDAAPSRALRSARRPAEAGLPMLLALRRHRRRSSSLGVPCHETLSTSVPVWVSGSWSCSSWPSGSALVSSPSWWSFVGSGIRDLLASRALGAFLPGRLEMSQSWEVRNMVRARGREGSTSHLRNGLAGDRRPEVDVTARSEAQDHDPVVLLLRAHDVVLPAHEGGSVPSLPAEPLVEAVSAGGEGTQVEPRPHQRAGLAHHESSPGPHPDGAHGAHTLDLAGR